MRLDLFRLLDKAFYITPCTLAAGGFAYGLVSHLNYWSLIHPTNAFHTGVFSLLLGGACAIADWVLEQDVFQRTAKNPSVKYVVAALAVTEVVKRSWIKLDISATRGLVIGTIAHLVGWTCVKIYIHFFPPNKQVNAESEKENMRLDLIKLGDEVGSILPRSMAAYSLTYVSISLLNYWSFIPPTNTSASANFSALLGCAYAIADWFLSNQHQFPKSANQFSVKCVVAGVGLSVAVERSWLKIDISPLPGVVIGIFAHLAVELCVEIRRRYFPPKEPVIY